MTQVLYPSIQRGKTMVFRKALSRKVLPLIAAVFARTAEWVHADDTQRKVTEELA